MVDGGAGCNTKEEVLVAKRDAIVAFSHQDLADNSVCNLNVADCLMGFDLVASANRTITALALTLPRATSKDCGQDCSTLHETGRIIVTHMRSDWANDANWDFRSKAKSTKWALAGAAGNNDVAIMDLAIFEAKTTDPLVTIALDVTKISPFWKGEPSIAVRTRAVAPFQFVLQRAKSGSPPIPQLVVTYCQ